MEVGTSSGDSKEKKNFNCTLCNMKISGEESMQLHLAGKTHKKNDEQTRQVFVRGYPKSRTTVDDLFNVFIKFGDVQTINMEGALAIVTFYEKESVTLVTKASPLPFRGNDKLWVKAHQSKVAGIVHKSKQSVTPFRESLTALSGGFHQQLEELLRQVRPPHHYVQTLAALCDDLVATVQRVFPGARAVPFGSMVTGLALKWSDVDCYIELPNTMRNNPNHDTPEQQRYLVMKTKSALWKNTTVFGEIFCVPNANTPIVKFKHMPTGCMCDVNFKNALGVHNSALIKFFIQSDPRMLPLFVFIKYWCKIHEITSVNRFSGYSIYMMIIFYLQNLREPILPPIYTLQNSPFAPIWESGWNCAFNYGMPPTTNGSDILTLIEGFFNFYGQFPFGDHVISPFMGDKLKRELFVNINLLPRELELYAVRTEQGVVPLKLDKCIIVQDPFELNRNVCCAIHPKFLDYFAIHCRMAGSLIGEAQRKNQVDKIIENLMNQEVKEQVTKKRKVLYEMVLPYPIRISIQFQNRMSLVTENDYLCAQEEMSALVTTVVTKVLMGTITKDKVGKEFELCLNCNVKMNLWDSRKKYSDKVSKDNRSALDYEISLSEYMTSVAYKNDLVAVACDITFKIILKLRNKKSKGSFHMKIHFTKDLKFLTEHLKSFIVHCLR